jgi:phospholipid/cholesterol/gamma-HCH transport system permease protein
LSFVELILEPIRIVGRLGSDSGRHAGGLGILAWRSLVATLTGHVAVRDVLAQLYSIGVQSIPLVMVTAVLSGIVNSQQGGYQFTSSIPLHVLGSIVTSSIVLELGPVLTAVVVIGRVGARITAEIGTMQVSEQIDALYSLGRDPVPVLAAPRIIAGTLAMPALVGVANAVGVLDLCGFDIRLVEGIDSHHGAGNSGCKFPSEKLSPDVVIVRNFYLDNRMAR